MCISGIPEHDGDTNKKTLYIAIIILKTVTIDIISIHIHGIFNRKLSDRGMYVVINFRLTATTMNMQNMNKIMHH